MQGFEAGMAKPLSSRELADLAWSELADLIDLQLSPLGLAAMDALAPQDGETILDIGCGAGQTIRQLASRVGPSGHVIGVDIAPRLLAVARSRTADLGHVTLMQADAAALALPHGSVDGLFSRFGVMAMDDPVAAFSNFRRMTRIGGRLGFVCWRTLEENELDLLPLQSSGLEMAIDRTPVGFERTDFVVDLLQSSGFRQIAVEALDVHVSSGDLDAMTNVLTKVGPLGKLLREAPALLSDAEPKVRAALAARVDGKDVRLKAATWIVTAIAG